MKTTPCDGGLQLEELNLINKIRKTLFFTRIVFISCQPVTITVFQWDFITSKMTTIQTYQKFGTMHDFLLIYFNYDT